MRALSLLCLFALLAPACDGGGVDRIDNFDVRLSQEVTIEPGSALEVLLGQFPHLDAFSRLDLSQSAEFRNEDYGPEDVDSVVLESLSMRVISPEGQDLSFFGGVAFFVEAEGLPRKEIARAEDFEGRREVKFATTADDLQDYLLAKRGTITVEVTDSRRPDRRTVVAVDAVFDVDIDLF